MPTDKQMDEVSSLVEQLEAVAVAMAERSQLRFTFMGVGIARCRGEWKLMGECLPLAASPFQDRVAFLENSEMFFEEYEEAITSFEKTLAEAIKRGKKTAASLKKEKKA